ncbi:MAG: RNA polymerase sigma factor [Candidatus Dormibacteria bacterium]
MIQISPAGVPAVDAAGAAAPVVHLASDSRWFEALVEDHTGLAYSVALRVVGDPSVAEDVVQESFLSVWRQAGTFDSRRGSVRTWLLTVVRNRAIDRIRSDRARPTSAAADLDSMTWLHAETDVWAEVVTGLDRDTVRASLQRLPSEQRTTIELAYFSGLTHVEIAERMSVPLGTVKGRMRIGLQKMRVDLVPAEAA